jgi:hypothetical protein
MQGLHNQYIGLQGEVFVSIISTVFEVFKHLAHEWQINEWLSRNLSPDWDATQHWTSRSRNQMYPNSPFVEREKDFADFTYPDTSRKLTELLMAHGSLQNASHWLSSPITYHLEVKSTPELFSEPFYISNNQVNKVSIPICVSLVMDSNSFQARQLTVPWGSNSIPTDVYVILRVYDLEKDTGPGFTAYVDPWAMYMNRQLSFMAQDVFVVTPNGSL